MKDNGYFRGKEKCLQRHRSMKKLPVPAKQHPLVVKHCRQLRVGDAVKGDVRGTVHLVMIEETVEGELEVVAQRRKTVAKILLVIDIETVRGDVAPKVVPVAAVPVDIHAVVAAVKR